MSFALFAIGDGLIFVAGLLCFGNLADERRCAGLAALGSWLAFLGTALDGSDYVSIFFGCFACIWTWVWWRNRRKGRGKKALQQLGAKSKARIQALVRRITPSPIPSPVGGRS